MLRFLGERLLEVRFLASVLATPGQPRHLRAWMRSRAPGYLLDTPSPWLTFDAISHLRSLLRDGLRIFEFGSGGSTLFWLKWRVELCSVEHDAAWHDAVRRRLPSERRVDYRLVPPEPFAAENLSRDPSDPRAYSTADEALRGHTFRRYASQIDEFPDGHFDIVLVDGRARPSCMLHALRKVRPGGVIVLDNADRDYYVAGLRELLLGLERMTFPGLAPISTAMTRTDLYRRR